MIKHKYERYPVQIPVVYSGDLVEGDGTVLNLSMGGCAVEGTAVVQGGAYLYLRIYLRPDETPMKVELAAVRWASDKMFGVEFIRQTAEEQERLRQFIHLLKMKPNP